MAANSADSYQAAVREDSLDGDSEIRTRAATGVAWVAGGNMVIKAMALLGNVALARLLVPSQFGLVAFGLTVLAFGEILSDGGLGAGLIRRKTPPKIEELRVLLGYQLIFTLVLSVGIASVAATLGETGSVTAVMMTALPLFAFRTPTLIVLERRLNFSPLIKAEAIEQLAYYAWGVALVALGAGVWGLATASIVKAIAGTAAMLRVSPVARLTPQYSWQRLRPMLGFGMTFQAVILVNAVRSLLLNIAVALVAGLATLGIWTLAWRLLQVPFLLFGPLWRVSYPASAQFLASGRSAGPVVERSAGLVAVATGFMLAPLAGAVSPAIPAVFGEQWSDVTSILLPIFFAIQVGGPVSVATAGYLYAVGNAAVVLRVAILVTVAWLLVSVPLLGPLGPAALGLGGMVASLLEAYSLSRSTRRHTGARFLKPILTPWMAATIAGFSACAVSRAVDHGILAAALGAGVGLGLYAIPIMLLRGDAVKSIVRLTSEILRRRGAADAPSLAAESVP